MKKYIKLYALLAMALFVGSCEDELDFGRDNNKSTTPATIVSGGEIVFGASAAKKSTRTIYGNPFDSNDPDEIPDKIELKWVVDDCVQIASPQSVGMAGGVAEYKVTGVTNSTSGNHPSTATLERTGAAGLQWGNVDEGTPYDFYAVYPSVNQLKKSIPASVADTCGLTADGKLKGYLPNTQVVKISDESASNNYVFEPNMDYAYMVAKEAYKIPKLDAYDKPIDGQDVSIDLNFSSVVTALKFTIKPGEIGLNNGEISTIRVTDLTLFSASGKELCGAFECDFKTGSYETNNAYSGFSQVAMKLGENGCTLSSGSGSITTTFFLLPIENVYTRGDLMLRIHYYVGDVPQYMTARLGVDIPVSQMTYINNLTMKPLKESVEGSSWFSALNSNIYVSQVSIPVAGNVFANSVYGAPNNNHQQSMMLDELWNMGVRGFEIVTQSAANLTGDLGDCKVVVAEHLCDPTGTENDYTFHRAFKELVGMLKQNRKETLVILASYMAVNDGYNPYAYVSNLFNYLTRCTKSGDDYYIDGLSANDFVQLTASSTVGDIQGKIVIVVRPGDDERWGYESVKTSNNKDNPASPYHDNNLDLDKYPADGLTNKIANKLGDKSWYGKVMCVWDWGTASYDVWDRRYGSDYTRAAAFNDLALTNGIEGISGKKQIEKYLYGSNKEHIKIGEAIGNFVHSGDQKDNNFNNYGADPTEIPAFSEFNYSHDLSNEGTAYVQEWMRVIPDGGVGECVANEWGLFSPRSLWVKWPSSIKDKKDAIKALFEKSVGTKGGSKNNDLYINVLSGYYATNSIDASIYPFKNTYSAANGNLTLSGMGKGGNFQGLAYDLNTYVYNLLSATPGTDNGLSQEGPWGLVIMDHIGNPTTGNEDKSKALVNLIMMNNFRFPLAQKPVVQGASVQRIPLSDESVDINKNIMVTWE